MQKNLSKQAACYLHRNNGSILDVTLNLCSERGVCFLSLRPQQVSSRQVDKAKCLQQQQHTCSKSRNIVFVVMLRTSSHSSIILQQLGFLWFLYSCSVTTDDQSDQCHHYISSSYRTIVVVIINPQCYSITLTQQFYFITL